VTHGRSAAVQEACDRAAAAARRGDPQAALRGYEYAMRLAPTDSGIVLSLAALHLGQHDPRAAAGFELIARRDDVQEAWLGLAVSHHRQGRHALAAQNLRHLLSRHGYVRGSVNLRLQDAIALGSGEVGWCGMSADGRLRVTLLDAAASTTRLVILIDGSSIAVRPSRRSRDGNSLRTVYILPDGWREANLISVCLMGRHMCGSPLEAARIGQLEGFVAAQDGGLIGWAWFRHDPDCAPELTVCDANGTTFRTVASDPALEVAHAQPLARPRGFTIPAAKLRGFAAPVAVLDAGGHNLYGSPVDPLADRRSAAGAAELARRRFPASTRASIRAVDLPLPAVPADIMGVRPTGRRVTRAAGVDVVISVYRGHKRTMACIRSVLASLPTGARCIVVEDASPETALIAKLRGLADRGRIVLQRQKGNCGYPATTNAGIRAAAGRDAILLNSDTLVPPGWIERLREAAYSGSDIGTATPLSNDATLFSYPRENERNPMPDEAATVRLDRVARQANADHVVDVPTAHGFCMYLRRDCLSDVGLLREDLFAQGYGEENDLCIRARHLGWRHVAVPGVFVAHAGSTSFDGARAQLLARNLVILNRLHPGYDALIADFRRTDPLAAARLRIDALRWRRMRSRKGAVILITHRRAGGSKRHVTERCQAITATGMRAILVTPSTDRQGRVGCQISNGSDEGFPNLRFDPGSSLANLAAFLRGDKPRSVELHHFIGHDPALLALADALDVPYDIVVHDYAWICPRITLIGADKRYCGEPDAAACEACYADVGGNIEYDINPSRLRLRSRGLLEGARRVVVPSADVASRLQRFFPGLTCTVTPWESDAALPPPDDRSGGLRRRIAIVGAIGIEKGYEYLLACARHVAARNLGLEFVVVGHTCDDRRLLDTGVVHITGPYDEAEAVTLIRSQQAELGFLPSLWPETWSYTLSQMWRAGLDVVAFDLGAPAERIRATGHGRLLPLGLPPASACGALLDYKTGQARPPEESRPPRAGGEEYSPTDTAL
jgi:GT2 family glycosyltransferase